MHIHAELHQEMKTMLHMKTSSLHKEMTQSSKRRHVKHVNSLKQTLQIIYKINLFSDGPAISISTGKEVDAGIITGLLNSKTLGNESYLTFVNDRLHWKEIFF